MPTKFSELPNIFRAKASAYLRAHDGAAVNRLTRFGAYGGCVYREPYPGLSSDRIG
jgi:hypothetical protein